MRAYGDPELVASPRIRGIGYCIAAGFLSLAMYLWQMQAIRGEEYARMSRSNRVRFVRIPAPRGLMYDRNGTLLVDNRPSFDVEVVPEDVEDGELLERRLGEILETDPATVRDRLKKGRPVSYLPVTLAEDVSMQTVLALEERQPMLPGVHVGVYPRRRYINHTLAAHCIGYLGMIDQGELEELRERGYTQQDMVGKAGVEKSYERYLAGRAGGQGIQVDSRGYLDKVLYRREPEPGCALYLNLDRKTQRAAEAILDENTGAVVALDPMNGEVLALASSPAFDPGDFIPPVDAEVVHDCISSETRPLFNRAIQGLYPPGSVFKPLTALAALESGAMNKSSGISCSGIFMLGKHPYKCWLERGHGSVTMVDAIMMSCNVFFYNAGIRAGRDEMVTMACEFGLDEKTGIDIPGERSGVVPTAAWCAARGITRWNPGDTVVMAIGQGYVLLTPLRAAVYMAAIANGGTLYTPHVVNRIVSPLGDLVERFAPAPAGHIDVSERNLALVQEGLKKVVNSNFGTGQKARLEGVAIAGKTGTVQVGPEEMRVNHSWFVGYAPCDQPRVVIAVLLEHKESGGFFAAPAAKKVFAAHFGVEENK